MAPTDLVEKNKVWVENGDIEARQTGNLPEGRNHVDLLLRRSDLVGVDRYSGRSDPRVVRIELHVVGQRVSRTTQVLATK